MHQKDNINMFEQDLINNLNGILNGDSDNSEEEVLENPIEAFYQNSFKIE